MLCKFIVYRKCAFKLETNLVMALLETSKSLAIATSQIVGSILTSKSYKRILMILCIPAILLLLFPGL